ncbi:BnaC04g26890D [Brassica napus]|uniref:BnaC04g26890D protein n=1 Tax=Brassica napus TaxID=3708 RepID=A0A078FJ00_BRANA|nr:BnaC04g26890D [Brassica napus]
MEEVPSPVIVFENNLVSTENSLVSPRSPEHGSPLFNQIDHNEQDDGDRFMSDAMANLTMSRGRRLIKPLQNFQDMEWRTTRGRGKQGRRGREYYHPSS